MTIEMFQQDFRRFLRSYEGSAIDDRTTISEFRRWLRDDLVSFNKISAHEQFRKKIEYEDNIGNNSPILRKISLELTRWANMHEDRENSYQLYHGTIEKNLPHILKQGIKVGVWQRANFKGFEADSQGYISLTPNLSDAMFFAGAAAAQKKDFPVIIVIDKRKLDKSHIITRGLFDTKAGEVRYSKDIPTSAILYTRTILK